MLKEKWPYFVLAAFAVLLIVIYRYHSAPQTDEGTWDDVLKGQAAAQNDARSQEEKSGGGKTAAANGNEAQNGTIMVDVKGAVKRPGVYEMKSGDRVIDVLEKAGGLTDKADNKNVNFAKKLTDEMVVYIPAKGEKPVESAAAGALSTGGTDEGAAAAGGEAEKININTASEEELQKLPGIGPAKAASIVAYRQKHGPFRSVDELDKVSGIGEKSLERIKPLAVAQ